MGSRKKLKIVKKKKKKKRTGKRQIHFSKYNRKMQIKNNFMEACL